jgi:hypothetical protein
LKEIHIENASTSSPDVLKARSLYQKNIYKKPTIFFESEFDRDYEGENFYLVEKQEDS